MTIEQADKQYHKYLEGHISNVQEALELLHTLGIQFIDDNYEELKSICQNHDASKYSDEEYIPYREHFYPTCDEDKLKTEAFELACRHHIKNNKHHWDYWLDENNQLDIPNEQEYKLYCVERCCDWLAMSCQHDEQSSTWYYANKESIQMPDYGWELCDEIMSKVPEKCDFTFKGTRGELDESYAYAKDVTTKELDRNHVMFITYGSYGEHVEHFDNVARLFDYIKSCGGFKEFKGIMWFIKSDYKDGEFYLVRDRYHKGGWKWEDVNGSIVDAFDSKTFAIKPDKKAAVKQMYNAGDGTFMIDLNDGWVTDYGTNYIQATDKNDAILELNYRVSYKGDDKEINESSDYWKTLEPKIEDTENDRKGVEMYKEKISNGYHRPILVNKNNEILDGNHTMTAYQELGIEPKMLYRGERSDFYKAAAETKGDAEKAIHIMIQNGTAKLIESSNKSKKQILVDFVNNANSDEVQSILYYLANADYIPDDTKQDGKSFILNVIKNNYVDEPSTSYQKKDNTDIEVAICNGTHKDRSEYLTEENVESLRKKIVALKGQKYLDGIDKKSKGHAGYYALSKVLHDLESKQNDNKSKQVDNYMSSDEYNDAIKQMEKEKQHPKYYTTQDGTKMIRNDAGGYEELDESVIYRGSSDSKLGSMKSGTFFAGSKIDAENFGDVLAYDLNNNAKIYKGNNSRDYNTENGLNNKKYNELINLTGFDNLTDINHAWDEWEPGTYIEKNPNLVYAANQYVARLDLESKGYDGAEWSYEDDLIPHQFQIWNNDMVKRLDESFKIVRGERGYLLEASMKQLKRKTLSEDPTRAKKSKHVQSKYIGISKYGVLNFETTSETHSGVTWYQEVHFPSFNGFMNIIEEGDVIEAEDVKKAMSSDNIKISCFTEDTEVQTLDGMKKIKDIKVGDKVLTHTGKYQDVLQTFENDYNGEMIEINGVKSTPNHPYLVKLPNGDIEWKMACEITKDMKLLEVEE